MLSGELENGIRLKKKEKKIRRTYKRKVKILKFKSAAHEPIMLIC